jgi:hypothetical protein
MDQARFGALREKLRQEAEALRQQRVVERKIRVSEDRKFANHLRFDQSRFWAWNWGRQDPARSGYGCATRAIEEDTGAGMSRRISSAGAAP